MADLNVCAFTGRLGNDVKLEQTNSGKSYARFSLAVQGFRREDVYWLDFQAWGKSAELLAQYRHKGDAVGVQAHATVDQWTAKDGSNRSKVVFVVDSMPLNAGSCKHQGAGAPSRGNEWESNAAAAWASMAPMDGFDAGVEPAF